MDKETFRSRIKTLRGFEARHYLLARAMGRGIPYRVLELKVRPHHEPRPSYIWEALFDKQYDPIDEPELLPIRAWLEVPATPEMIERAERLRQEYFQKKRERAARIKQERFLKGFDDDARIGK